LHPGRGSSKIAGCQFIGAAVMKGDPKILQHLNLVLKNELTAINQYFLHARMFGHWGLDKLEDTEKDESIDEMKHADKLIGRILFLDGLPNLQDLGKLLIGENVKEALECDLKLEMAARVDLKVAIADSESLGDYVSRELFESILESEEEHIDYLETQLDLITRIGIENYCQSQIGAEDE
jgi:bacterioferritin